MAGSELVFCGFIGFPDLAQQKAVQIGLAPYTESLDNSGSIPELSNESETGVTGNAYYFLDCGWPLVRNELPSHSLGQYRVHPHPGVPKSTPDRLVHIRV